MATTRALPRWEFLCRRGVYTQTASPVSMSHRRTRPAARQPLELDQPADVPVEVREGRVDHGVLDRPDGVVVGGVGLTALQPADGGQPLVDGGRDQFLADGPLEDADDPPDPLVDQVSAPARPDELLADRLQRETRAEGRGPRLAVQLADVTDDELVVLQLAGRRLNGCGGGAGVRCANEARG
jgi:hypothetical protein